MKVKQVSSSRSMNQGIGLSSNLLSLCEKIASRVLVDKLEEVEAPPPPGYVPTGDLSLTSEEGEEVAVEESSEEGESSRFGDPLATCFYSTYFLNPLPPWVQTIQRALNYSVNVFFITVRSMLRRMTECRTKVLHS